MSIISWVSVRLQIMLSLLRSLRRASAQPSSAATTDVVVCSADGAPPMRTVQPVTVRPSGYQGTVLTFEQQGTTRYACLHPPQQAVTEAHANTRQWPLLIYLHGSLTTPNSLYWFGRELFHLRHSYPLSSDPNVRGFMLLAPEGRRANPWSSEGPHTGVGFHWDEWYRNPTENLDALAIDHFVDAAIATGQVDRSRSYVFGWSNGAYMAVLYGIWRSDRIAAIAQYAGGDPWSRSPCPVPMQYRRQVPLVLLRNLCDALVPCAATSAWITTLTERGWPFTHYNLDLHGNITADSACEQNCSKIKGLYEHCRWPKKPALKQMLYCLKQSTL